MAKRKPFDFSKKDITDEELTKASAAIATTILELIQKIGMNGEVALNACAIVILHLVQIASKSQMERDITMAYVRDKLQHQFSWAITNAAHKKLGIGEEADGAN